MASDNRQNHRGGSRQQLTPPGSSPDESGKGGRGAVLWLLIGFIVLLCGAVTVVLFLPDRQKETPPVISVIEDPPKAPVPETAVNQQKAEAAAAREKGLSLRIEAESQNIVQWGSEKYAAVSSGFAEADELFTNGEYGAAAEKYKKASEALTELLDSKADILQAAYEAGSQALAEEKLREAEESFRLVLAIDPASDMGQSGLEKVRMLAAVKDLYAKGLQFEEEGKLKEAAAEFAKGRAIDNSYEPLRLASRRVEAKLHEEIFQDEMDSALSAIDNGEFTKARDSIKTLKELGIHRQQVEQAEELLREKETKRFVEHQRGLADKQREAEDWQAALKTYQKILSVAPQALFAAAGEAEAVKREKLDRSLRDTIAKPDRLQDKEQRLMAVQLLDYATRISPRGPRLQNQLDILDKQIVDAGTPLTVILESDNLTDVTVYHVGRLGKFSTKKHSTHPWQLYCCRHQDRLS